MNEKRWWCCNAEYGEHEPTCQEAALPPVRSEPLLADARRLDWLDKVNRSTNERNGTVYGWRFDINHNRAALSDHNLPALTVRQAIDEAMKANDRNEAQ